MKACLSLFVYSFAWLLYLASEAVAQSIPEPSSLSVTRIEYTDSELESFGFTQKELGTYSKRLENLSKT